MARADRRHFLGVLGGMGPLATAAFLRHLVEETPARTDQGHVPVLVYGDCTVPDRTQCLLEEGESPLPKLLEGIRFLGRSGVGAICIPCNSAHAWFDDLQRASRTPLVSIVDATVREVLRRRPAVKRVGILSTLSTNRARLYDAALSRAGAAVLGPTDREFATLITPGIALVKSGDLTGSARRLGAAADRLLERGAQSVVLACTEIPLALEARCRERPRVFIDSARALAIAALRRLRRR